MKFILSILLILYAGEILAEETAPASCKPLMVQEETLMLSASKPLLIIIHNLSKADIWVTHPVSEPGASAGWSTRLQAGNWSALVLDKEAFELSCIESKPGHEQQVPCKGLISACSWSTVTMPAQQATGTYWAGEDMTLSALISYLGGRGFALPPSPQ